VQGGRVQLCGKVRVDRRRALVETLARRAIAARHVTQHRHDRVVLAVLRERLRGLRVSEVGTQQESASVQLERRQRHAGPSQVGRARRPVHEHTYTRTHTHTHT
jgi:hypothetical protein